MFIQRLNERDDPFTTFFDPSKICHGYKNVSFYFGLSSKQFFVTQNVVQACPFVAIAQVRKLHPTSEPLLSQLVTTGKGVQQGGIRTVQPWANMFNTGVFLPWTSAKHAPKSSPCLCLREFFPSWALLFSQNWTSGPKDFQRRKLSWDTPAFVTWWKWKLGFWAILEVQDSHIEIIEMCFLDFEIAFAPAFQFHANNVKNMECFCKVRGVSGQASRSAACGQWWRVSWVHREKHQIGEGSNCLQVPSLDRFFCTDRFGSTLPSL